MKKISILFYILFIVTIFSFKNVFATEINYNNSIDSNDAIVTNLSNGCTGDNSILGSVNDPDSPAWLLQKILNYTKIIGPFAVIILSAIDYLRAIISSDDENMKKTHKKLIVRLVLAAGLFIIPSIVMLLLNLFGITSNQICNFK